MTSFGSMEIRRRAVRDFLASLTVLSVLFGGVPLYFFATSPAVPELLRLAIVAAIGISWFLAAIGMVRILRRDLTPIRLLNGGMQAGRRLVPYADIIEVDPQLGVRVFGLRLRNRRLTVYLSKIGVADEKAFFEELESRMSEARHSSSESSAGRGESTDVGS